MGRRAPQAESIRQLKECIDVGHEIPLGGFPSDSGYSIMLAEEKKWENELSSDHAVVVTMTPDGPVLNIQEWETCNSWKKGDIILVHQRSKTSGRARLIKEKTENPFKEEGSLTRFTLLRRNASAASEAHTITAERKAMKKLRTHLAPHQWRSYFLTGTFLEPSKRSRLMYMFRRNAPTIVCKIVVESHGIHLRPFATLCMHPIGYSEFSGIGCLCPSDDVIAHLLYMRADEYGYWKNANQHTIEDPVSML